MSLPDHIYKELEAVVGPRYISAKEYILAAIRQPAPHRATKPPSPVAVILPGSVGEVQEIVRICNKHDLRFIATVSTLIDFALPTDEGTVMLQMKRMNRIDEINREDRYAVIEPGGRHGQLRPELMNYGLS